MGSEMCIRDSTIIGALEKQNEAIEGTTASFQSNLDKGGKGPSCEGAIYDQSWSKPLPAVCLRRDSRASPCKTVATLANIAAARMSDPIFASPAKANIKMPRANATVIIACSFVILLSFPHFINGVRSPLISIWECRKRISIIMCVIAHHK